MKNKPNRIVIALAFVALNQSKGRQAYGLDTVETPIRSSVSIEVVDPISFFLSGYSLLVGLKPMQNLRLVLGGWQVRLPDFAVNSGQNQGWESKRIEQPAYAHHAPRHSRPR